MANSGPGWEAISNAWWHLNSEAIQQQRTAAADRPENPSPPISPAGATAPDGAPAGCPPESGS